MVNLKRDILSFGNHEFLIGGDLNMETDANAITATNNFNLDIKNRSPMSQTQKSSLHGVKLGLLLTFSDISILTVEFSVMSHLIKMITQDQELIIFYALQILFLSNLTYLPITTKLLDHKGVLLVPAKKSPQNLTFLDPSLLTISGLNQAV